MLQVADVTFGYGRRGRPGAAGPPLVLDGVSATVSTGALVGLLGPNGAGKSTLLKLIAGTLTPTRGHVRLDGADTSRMPRAALARRLAVVPQETELAFDYSALEIVLMGRYPHLGAFEVEGPADLEAARQAMTLTGTADLGGRAFRTLSGGEKQRVIIASALAQLAPGARGPSPDALLLLDEPTASLDLRYQLEIAALLRRLHGAGGLTIVVSSHDLRFVQSICTEALLLSGGRALAQGSPASVITPDLIGRVYGIDAAVAAPLLARP